MTVARGREAATVLCGVTVRLRQGKAVGPLKPGQTGSGVGFALCSSIAGDVPGSMLRQVGCCEHPQMENWRSWARPPLFMSSLEHMGPLLPFSGSLSSSMSVLSLSGTPTTLVLRGGEPEMDVSLAITAPSLRAEVRQVMAMPFQGPSASPLPGLGTSHTCLSCASQVPVQCQTCVLLYKLSPEG